MKISIYDKQLKKVAFVDEQFISCFWSEGYNTVENFSIELPKTDFYKKRVKPDFYVGRNDRKTLMVIKSVEFLENSIVAYGKQATRILDDLAFIGTIKENSLVDESIKNAYDSSEKIDNVQVKSGSLGVKYKGQISNKSFLGLFEQMCQSTDVGFRSVRENGTITIDFYQPPKNPNLVFSEKFGNLSIQEIVLSTENEKNYAIVLGSGEGENRTRVDVDLSNGSEKKQFIIDARQIQQENGETESAYKNRLYARGLEALLEKNKTWNCKFSPSDIDFGTKYDLGDILTVYLTEYGFKIQGRLARFTQKEQNNSTKTEIEVGNITILR